MGKANVTIKNDSLKIEHAYDSFTSERPWPFYFSIDVVDNYGAVIKEVIAGSTKNIQGVFSLEGLKSIRVSVNGVLSFERELGPDKIIHCSGYSSGSEWANCTIPGTISYFDFASPYKIG